jgi:sec-independent protein translocase protein TatA
MKFGIWELVIILAIVALLFGTRKLGTIGSDVGNAIKGFRKAMSDDEPPGAAPTAGRTDANAAEDNAGPGPEKPS